MAEKHILSAGHLTIGYYGKPVLTDVSLEVESGEVLCLLGPNGVGKSTLFKSVLGLIPLIKGDVTVDGKNAKDLPRKEFAQHVAYVPQNHTPPFAFSVMDMVLTGCVSRLKPFETPGKKEYEQAEAILDDLSIGHLRDRVFTQLSGGEAQMTLIARALMQDSNILLMDEPTASLDIGKSMDVLSVVKRLAGEGRGIVMITHDPDQCFLCATKVVLLAGQGKAVSGPVDDVITPANLKTAYGVDVRIVDTTDLDSNPIKACVPLLSKDA